MKTKLLKAYVNLQSDRGATAVEYALIVALIAVVIIAGVTLLGVNIGALFTKVAGDIPK